MQRRPGPSLLALLALLALFVIGTSAQGSKEIYCSGQNTGDTDVYDWPWQSNGNCTNHCAQQGNFAFAVLQDQDCYCSDYIPRDQQNLNRCATDCPGYPAEHCGNRDDGLYLYLELSGQPSGTAGGDSPSQPTSATSARPSSIVQSSQPLPEPATSVQIVTESGAVVTRTIVQTPTVNPASSSSSSSSSSFSSSSSTPVRTGNEDNGPNVAAIAGGAAGGAVGLVLLIGGLVFLLWRRRRRQQQAQAGEGSANEDDSAGITRNTSTMSKAGLLGRTTEVEPQYPLRIATNFSRQNSRFGADHESMSPMSKRTNSQLLHVDSRLNPNAIMTFAGANDSRDSFASVDDSRDYGRQLNVRNPDP